MDILMIKNFWRSGKAVFEAGKTYSVPKDMTEKLAKALISAGKASEKKKGKKRDVNG